MFLNNNKQQIPKYFAMHINCCWSVNYLL